MKIILITTRTFIFTLLITLTLVYDIPAQLLPDSSDRWLGASTGGTIFRNFNRYFNQVTPGNAGKWGMVEFTQGSYSWTTLDNIYDYAVQNGIMFKEHVLVWGSQEPSWVAALDSAAQREAVEKWFRAVGERYPQIAFVDVVNEPFHAVPSYKNALGGDGETGWDWIITAFQLARQYMPADAKLLLNEYNVLHSNTVTTNYLNIVSLLRERDLIDGIAVQGHYFEFRSDISSQSQYVYDINTIKANLKRLTDTGIPVYISEFDIDEPVDANQLEQYKIYFPIFWNNPGVKGITFWGYYQSDVWDSHPNTYLIKEDGRGRPAWDWLKTYIYLPLIPEPVSPVLQGDVPLAPSLVWTSSKDAESYTVQVSTSNRFTSLAVDTTITDTTLQLDTLLSNTRYYWHVSAANSYGQSDYSAAAMFTTMDVVSVDDEEVTPSKFELAQNYPNPFNPVTRITYSVPIDCDVLLKVYDLLGNEVAVLAEGFRKHGEYTIVFNAGMLPSGTYFYQLRAESNIETKKLLLLK
jgi:endo-1,4-beta-xylanase